MNLMKIATERCVDWPKQQGTGRSYRLIIKALEAANDARHDHDRGRILFVCRGGMEAYMRGLVKKAMKQLEGDNLVHRDALQWFQLWPLQRDLTSLRGVPHKFVLDHDVDCAEVRRAFQEMMPGRVL